MIVIYPRAWRTVVTSVKRRLAPLERQGQKYDSSARVALLCFFLSLPFFVASTAHADGPVVIELFTSEGCSSCPPADALLSQISGKTANGAQLIALGEHVDYWNSLGWKDRFSSAQFTERQNKYVGWLRLQTAYTPQMVIDGRIEVLGNDAHAVAKDIAAEAARPKSGSVTLTWDADGRLHVSAHASAQSGGSIVLAITEDDLATSIQGGENKGRTLQHAAVVRQLKPIGRLSQGAFDATVDVPPNPEWNLPKVRAVVFVQEPRSGEIIGAAALPYK